MGLRDTYQRVRPACFGIALELPAESGSNFFCFGSGACVHPSGLIITAKHVVTGYYEQVKSEVVEWSTNTAPEFEVLTTTRVPDGWVMAHARPTAILFHDHLDVAFLKLPERDGGWASFDVADGFDVLEGDAIATIGYPLRGGPDLEAIPNLSAGIISCIGGDYDANKGLWQLDEITMDMCIHPGNSGGPVFDAETGVLIGIVKSQRLRPGEFVREISASQSASQDEGELPLVWTNLSYCVPVAAFGQALTKAIHWALDPDGGAGDPI